MSKSYSLGDLMAMYYENEFSATEEVTLPQFSTKHNRKMKKAFNAFAENRTSAHDLSMTTNAKKTLSIRKQILFAAIIIVLLAFVTGGVKAFFSNSFRGTVYNDNTYIFAFDDSDSPTIIEEEYMLSVIPEGYELYGVSSASTTRSVVYKNASSQELIFDQTVKSEYGSHVNTEGHKIEEIDINGCDGIYIEFRYENFTDTLVIWNSNDYILMLYGNFAKDELVNLAKNNEIKGFI